MGLLEAICRPCLIMLLILADPSCCCGLGSELSWLCTAANKSHLTQDLVGISLSIRPGTAALIFLSPHCMHKGCWIPLCSPRGTWFWCHICCENLLNPPMDGAAAFSCSSAAVGTSPASIHSADGDFAPLCALCGQVGPWHCFPGLPKVHPPNLRFGNRMPVVPGVLQ